MPSDSKRGHDCQNRRRDIESHTIKGQSKINNAIYHY